VKPRYVWGNALSFCSAIFGGHLSLSSSKAHLTPGKRKQKGPGKGDGGLVTASLGLNSLADWPLSFVARGRVRGERELMLADPSVGRCLGEESISGPAISGCQSHVSPGPGLASLLAVPKQTGAEVWCSVGISHSSPSQLVRRSAVGGSGGIILACSTGWLAMDSS
jgi:hypothetical protein